MCEADFECAGMPDPNQVEEPVPIAGSGAGERFSGSCSRRRGFAGDVDGDELSRVVLFVLGFVPAAVDFLSGAGDCLRIGEIGEQRPHHDTLLLALAQ